LGLAGDPRFPVTLTAWRTELDRRNEQFGAPPGYWCYVRAGAYRIGGWKEGQADTLLELPDFWIARLPITVAQFAVFAEHGYTEAAQHLWTPNGWAWRTQNNRIVPNTRNDQYASGPNRPVTDVNWYEATAFCAWLTTQLTDALPAGFVLRLPTEAEWEAAAAFDAAMQRQPFPWGAAQPTPAHAILKASGIFAPAPVGCCPAGAAACGALDLLGNIEEWCASGFGVYPAGSAEQADDPPSGGNIVLGPLKEGQMPTRGGWWVQDAAAINCGERFWRYASASGNSIGFRVVLARR
jgi:formylglycine-generating enzyme required for sulfatase activity